MIWMLLACLESPELPDLDGDGFAADADCDDLDAAVFPGADEICNEMDDDCDGESDNDAIDSPHWYADADGDSFGALDDFVVQCASPVGFVDNDQDCDDDSPLVNPLAVENCDSDYDEDCDGVSTCI